MSVQLLDKTRKINKLLHNNSSSKVVFNDICEVGAKFGFAKTTKEYKENPEAYKGNPGDVSQIIRVAITGKQNSPDLYTVMNILGEKRVLERLKKAIEGVK